MSPLAPADGPRPWMRVVLRLAGVYNVLWGGLVVLFPLALFRALGLDTSPRGAPGNVTVPLWQCIGMIIGVYGVGYWIAAGDPYRHWPIILVGLLGKIFGPIGFVDAVLIRGIFPLSFGWTILTNDLIWWAPFGLILLGAWRHHRRPVATGSHVRSGPRRAKGASGSADTIG